MIDMNATQTAPAMEKTVADFKAKLRRMDAYNHALGVMHYDSETAMPRGGAQDLSRALEVLSEESYKMGVEPAFRALMQEILDNREQVDYVTRREAEEGMENLERMEKIPMEEYVAYQVACNEAVNVWKTAKETNDFALFAPHLQKLLDFKRRFAGYWDASKAPYDVLLDRYEKGVTMETLDAFFSSLREKLVPLIKAIAQKGPAVDDAFAHRSFPVHMQRLLSDYAMEVMTIDRNCCGIGETEHPFTTSFSKHDVRITTHYYENEFLSSLYSVIHEGGHALYELHTGDALIGSPLAGGASMGIHESQSRFYENIIGRSEPFITHIYPQIQRLNPEQFQNVSAHQMYLAANVSQPSLIRTEADELTYCFHFMIRYELEKRLIDGSLQVAELPGEWNSLYKEYLGIEVPSDTLGVLQDSHWSGGSFGYFPSYALGSAYGAQILSSMEKDLPVWELVGRGELAPIVDWLTERIYRYGRLLNPRELLQNACGADFDPAYYVEYLKNKFTEVYGL